MRTSLDLWQHHLFCAIAVAAGVALAWPVFESFTTGTPIRGEPVSIGWFAAFGVFAAAVVAAMVLPLPREA